MNLPVFLSNGGPVLWLILVSSAVAIAVFIERYLHCHRAQINSTEFLNGVRTVLKRDNVVEALSICDATPGPVARLVKTAILFMAPPTRFPPRPTPYKRWADCARLENPPRARAPPGVETPG